MPALQEGDIVEVRWVCSTAEQIGVNRRHYRVGEVSGAAEIDGSFAANDVSVATHQEYKALLSAEAMFRGVAVQKIFPLPRMVADANTDNAGAGSIVGDILPKQTSGIITLETDVAGPAGRGRVYIPFPSETSSDDEGRPVAAYITALQNLGNVLVLGFSVGANGVGTTLESGLWNQQSQVFTPFKRFKARPFWATQRRRGDYGQRNIMPF